VRNLVCNARDDRKFLINGVARIWANKYTATGQGKFVVLLARGLLGEDGKSCAATADLNDALKGTLRDLISEAAKPAEPTPPAK
jgi:hypothetical protein